MKIEMKLSTIARDSLMKSSRVLSLNLRNWSTMLIANTMVKGSSLRNVKDFLSNLKRNILNFDFIK
jgi:hypothetical protein